MRARNRISNALLVPLAMALCLCAGAEPVEPPDGPQYRDAVIDAYGGYLYLAAYNFGEVHQVDLRTQQITNTIAVGQGPVALALNDDGSVLGVVNRLGGTLSLVGVPGLVSTGEAECGQSPVAVAPLPAGGFAVPNSFSDTVTLIHPDRPDSPETLYDVRSVPIGVAASSRYLAVATKAPSAIVLFPLGHDAPEHAVSLDAGPLAIEYAGSGRFVVATTEGLVLIDETPAAITAQADTPVIAIATEGDRIYALAPEFVLVFNSELEQQGHIPLREEAQAFTAAGDVVVALSPAQQRWHIHGVFNDELPLAWSDGARDEPLEKPSRPEQDAPGLQPRPALEPILPEEDAPRPDPFGDPEVDATPLPPLVTDGPEGGSAPLPEVRDAEPIENPSTNGRNSSSNNPSNPHPVPGNPSNDAVNSNPGLSNPQLDGTTLANNGETAETPPRPVWRAPGVTPIAGADATAPGFSRQPPGLPLIEREGRTLTDAITQGLRQAFQEDGFEQPDWTQPFRDIQGDRIQRRAQEITAEGNVRLTLDTIDFSADSFFFNPETGELRAEGNVILRQQDAVITANRIHYHVPSDRREHIETSEPYPLTPDDGIPSPRQALSMGILTAEQIDIDEPLRQVSADSLRYDFAEEAGCIENLRGSVSGLYFGVAHLEMAGPDIGSGEDAWFSTCDHDVPHYRVRLAGVDLDEGESVTATGLQLEVGNVRTPIYWPRWAYYPGRRQTLGVDFDSGRAAQLGYYVNYGQHFLVNPDIELGFRLYPTEKAGVGFGVEGSYDFTQTPTSPLFMGQGEFRSMLTTKEDGYIELYHRHKLEEDTVLLLQAEQWFKRDFVKDFYYDIYRHRTEPRSFANITHTRPNFIATGTYRQTTHNFVAETERLPEVSFHILERPLVEGLYFSYDGVAGYNVRQPAGTHAARAVNVARLTLDLDLHGAFSVTPFAEFDATLYSHMHRDSSADMRFSSTVGTTVQTRFHKTYGGALGFAAFKHIIVPSITYSYRPSPNMNVDDTPRFDAYDNVYGRSRIESRIENVLFGRDAVTHETWQVARLSFFQGHDLWNELRRADQIELELDVRPRPWWGVLLAAERHRTSRQIDIDSPYSFERLFLSTLERFFDRPVDPELLYRFNAQYGDYERIMSYVYYDDTPQDGRFNARLGFAYTKTRDQVFNREVLYGAGYRFNENWSAAFEHRYDFDRGDLYRQTYEIRRNLHCWEAAIRFRDRTQGWDVGFEMSLTGIPGARVAF